MNSLWFYFDDYDKTIECRYYEDVRSGKYVKITLPQEKYRSYFESFYKKYYMEDKFTDNSVIHQFYDVDVDEIDKIIEESKRFINPQVSDFKTIEVKSTQTIKKEFNSLESNNTKPKRKVTRINLFRNGIIVLASAALISSIGAFSYKNSNHKTNQLDSNNEYIIEENEIDDKKDLELDYISDSDNKNLEESDSKNIDSFTDESVVISESNEQSVNDKTDSLEIGSDSEIEPDNHESDNNINFDYSIEIYASNESDGETAFITESYYGEAIKNAANTYGIDYNVLRAIGTHERGVHSSTMDSGGGIGLYQIQIGGSFSWIGSTVKAYNFKTNQWDEEVITTEKASDVFSNIKLGAMIFQECLRRNNYDIAKAVTEYNYGTSNLQVVVNNYSQEIKNYNNDPSDLGWLKYRSLISGGDSNYLENVFKYIENGTILTFYTPNGECINIKYDNLNKNMAI